MPNGVRINQPIYGTDIITYRTLSPTNLILRRRADGYGPLRKHRDRWLVTACTGPTTLLYMRIRLKIGPIRINLMPSVSNLVDWYLKYVNMNKNILPLKINCKPDTVSYFKKLI
jgi:hypothetical protein